MAEFGNMMIEGYYFDWYRIENKKLDKVWYEFWQVPSNILADAKELHGTYESIDQFAEIVRLIVKLDVLRLEANRADTEESNLPSYFAYQDSVYGGISDALRQIDLLDYDATIDCGEIIFKEFARD
jgi:hypothetical protein